jgi:catechol 2,3-dioxygenase-like lactoylglutathione lyase family enzyme
VISALDHIALAVNDLDAAVDGYTRLLGLAPNWIGGDGGARHAWFQLPDMALDIITPDGEGAFGDTIRAHLAAHGEGIWAMALTAPDIDAAQGLLARRGLPASKPHPVRSTHDDGRKRYWTTSALERDAAGGLNIMIVAPPRDGSAWPLSEPTGEAPITRLDHVVVYSPNPDRALAVYGAKLGLDLRLDRSNADWGVRQLFFRCGDSLIEVGSSLKRPVSSDPDSFGGLAWQVADIDAAHARLVAAGFDVGEPKTGRKPGTKVFTVRSGVPAGPALIIQQGERP